MRIAQQFGGFIREWKAAGCKRDRWCNQLTPFLCAIFRSRQVKAAHTAGHAHRTPAINRVLSRIALRVQIHVACGLFRRALAKVDESGPAVSETHQHESSAAEVTGKGVRNRQREAHRHGGIHCIAATLEHREAHVGR